MIQLKFNFENKNETDMLWDELELTHSKLNNLRKGLFKRHSALEKMYKDLDERLKAIEQPCEMIDLPLFEILK